MSSFFQALVVSLILALALSLFLVFISGKNKTFDSIEAGLTLELQHSVAEANNAVLLYLSVGKAGEAVRYEEYRQLLIESHNKTYGVVEGFYYE